MWTSVAFLSNVRLSPKIPARDKNSNSCCQSINDKEKMVTKLPLSGKEL
jgi:hypothetical protein